MHSVLKHNQLLLSTAGTTYVTGPLEFQIEASIALVLDLGLLVAVIVLVVVQRPFWLRNIGGALAIFSGNSLHNLYYDVA